MKPNFVAKKSAFAILSFWWILSCILIIPFFILLFKILALKTYEIEFYDNKIVVSSGLVSKKSHQFLVFGIMDVRLNQSARGLLFNYGDLIITSISPLDIDTTYIKDPHKLYTYLKRSAVKTDPSNMMYYIPMGK